MRPGSLLRLAAVSIAAGMIIFPLMVCWPWLWFPFVGLIAWVEWAGPRF